MNLKWLKLILTPHGIKLTMKTKHQNARPKIVGQRSFDPHIATIVSEKFKLKLLG